ncbi:MAG: azr 1 [Acidobacteria bacterium]|nr:azr 1 [Acidobacteriota bacterium]
MRVITLNGSLRARSSNAALLRAAMNVAPDGMELIAYSGLGELPHFNPDLDAEDGEAPAVVRELRELLIGADAILISSPEYAHGVPGAFKNLLDWLVSVGELVDKPVALLNASPSGGDYAQVALLETLRTMNWRVVEEASLVKPFVRRKIVDELTDDDALALLRGALHALMNAVIAARSDS